MALRDWEAGRIGRMWVAGMIAELLVVVALFVIPEFQDHDIRPAWAGPAQSAAEAPKQWDREEWHRILQDSFGISVSVVGDTLTTFRKDSFSVTALTHGDTLRRLDLSPAAQRSVSAVVEPIGRVLVQLVPAMIAFILLVMAVTLLPIPLALTILTLLWWRARRRMPPTRPEDP